jgi:hypothetical protein
MTPIRLARLDDDRPVPARGAFRHLRDDELFELRAGDEVHVGVGGDGRFATAELARVSPYWRRLRRPETFRLVIATPQGPRELNFEQAKAALVMPLDDDTRYLAALAALPVAIRPPRRI